MMEPISGARLSPQQRRLWLSGGAAVSHCRAVIAVDGAVDEAALRRAALRLVERHEILRTTFRRTTGVKLPLQVVGEPGRLSWETRELPADDLEKAADRLLAEPMVPFQPAAAPALSVVLLPLSESRRLLLLTLPSLCADAWSLEILSRELAEGLSLPAVQAEDGDEVVQYQQYSEWQNTLLEQGSADSGGVPVTAVPILPSETTRQPAAGAEESTDLATLWFRAGQEAVMALARLTPGDAAAVLLGSWQALLWRLSGQAELAIDVLFENRDVPDLAQTVGPFARAIPVRSWNEAGLPFAQTLEKAKNALADAAEQVSLPGSALTGEPQTDGSSRRVGFELLPASLPKRGNGVTWTTVRRHGIGKRWKLKLSCDLQDGALVCSLDYAPAAFGAAEVERLAAQWRAVLASALAAPQSALRELDYLGEAERRELVEELNRTTVAFRREQCAHDLIAKQAALTPQAAAVSCFSAAGREGLSYADLEQRANRLAHHLRRLGVGPDRRVGLLLHRSPDMVVAILATLKAGGAYVPLDPSYPHERLAYLVSDCAPCALVTTRELAQRLTLRDREPVPTVCLDGDRDAIAGEPATPPPALATPDNLAYVIYTSGSTGRPKGVMVPHRGLVNYLSWCTAAYGAAAGGAPVHSPLGFDLTVTSLLAPLTAGACATLIDETQGTDGLAAALRQGGFSLAKLTPSHLQVLAAEPASTASLCRGARTWVIGGEALLAETLSPWLDAGVRLINEYGPTETVVGCCVHEIRGTPEPGPVPIGRPIANTRLYVLDEALRPLPRWVAGELHVAGEGVTRGYWQQPDLTAASFVPDPFANDGSRLYRTGDLVFFRGDGELVFAGRRDDQVKVRGYRIELAEIEQALLSNPAVREAVVVARREPAGDQRLVAYWTAAPQPAHTPTVDELRRDLAERLPDYMLPSAFALLPALPLNAHGKVDRAALPKPDDQRPELEQAYVAPRTVTEELLADIWSQVLGVERIGIHDNFFTLGGDSMRIVQAAAFGREQGLDLQIQDYFRRPTIAGLAELAAEQGGSATHGTKPDGTAPGLEQLLDQVEGLSDEQARDALRERLPDIVPEERR